MRGPSLAKLSMTVRTKIMSVTPILGCGFKPAVICTYRGKTISILFPNPFCPGVS